MALTITLVLIIKGINDIFYESVYLPSSFARNNLYVEFPFTPPTLGVIVVDTSLESVFIIFGMILMYVLYEEVIFRLIPVFLGKKLLRNKYSGVVYILFISFVFGFYHGHLHNVLSQGVAGVFFVYVFLKGVKTGGYVRGMYASTMIHLVNNIIALWFLNDYQLLFQ